VWAVGEPLSLDGAVSEDSATKDRIAQATVLLKEIRRQVVAKSSAVIQGDSKVGRVAECEMSNLVADAMLDRVADQAAETAIANSGGLRASIDVGDVTMGNTLATFQISGQRLIDALENGVSQVEEVKGWFPQGAGLKFIWDPKGAPNEGRVVEILVAEGLGFFPIDRAAIYMAFTNNYAVMVMMVIRCSARV
jgi:5'-nucleotidase/UDP-sugar diphosphatase